MAAEKYSKPLADHETLFEHPECTITRSSIIQDLEAGQYETARTRLQRAYSTCFDIHDSDWEFLRALASVRNGMVARTILTHGECEPKDCISTTLLKGHGPIRDLFDAEIDQLIEAELIRYPRIRGEERRRIIYKPYYVLTPEATDCIDVGLIGPQVGDLGETVVHAVGARLYGEYMKHKVPRKTGQEVTVEYYSEWVLNEHTVDVAVYTNQEGKPNTKNLYAVGEVKTVIGSDSEVIRTMHKMGAVQCEHKHWIAPRRELINEILNVAALREWYTMDTVPESLSLETKPDSGIRSTNDRLDESTYCPDVPGAPMATPLTEGYTYAMLYRTLKESDPTLFDAPKVSDAWI